MADFLNTYVDVPQTGMAVRRFQTARNFIAPFLAPRKLVKKPSGLYTVWRMADLNRDELVSRGPSAPPTTSAFNRDLVPFKTDVRSLAFDLNAAQAAAADDDSDPEQMIPLALGYKALIGAELRVAQTFFQPNAWYRVVTGAAQDAIGADGSPVGQRKFFDDPTTDPVTAIGDEIRMQGLLTGQDPIAMVFGRRLWHFLRNHPKVRAALVSTTIPVIQARPATLEQMAALLELEWIGVSKAIYNTALENEAPTNRLIVPPNDALLYFAPSPGSLDADPAMSVESNVPTAALVKLVWNGVSGVALDGIQVRTFPDPNAGPGGSMRSVIDVYNGYQVVTREMGTLFRNMVSS
jgi:hypothetical protein